MHSWMTDTVIRIRPEEKEVRGSTVPDWDNTNDLAIGSCSMQPATTSLNEDGRVLGLVDGYTLYAPISADIIAGDRIAFDGQTYAINGDIRKWQSPAGNMAHLVVNLMRYSG